MKASSLLCILPFVFACGGNNNNDPEVCNDQIDNDGDTLVDCNDDQCAADAACQNPPAVVGGFQSPESVFFDTDTSTWYVTNQGGQGAGDGFVSKLDAVGNVVELNFATGLDNPRGSRAVNGKLYVADDNGVFVIDLLEGLILDEIDPGVVVDSFLNDVAVDPASGDVFVSDSGTGIIHRLAGGVTPSVFLQDAQFDFPNGLLFENGTLFITNFGDGKLFSFNPAADPALSVIVNGGLGQPDGIERDGTNLLVTDFGGRLLNVDANGAITVLFDGSAIFDAAADLAFDPARRVAAVPELFGTEVNFIDLDDL